MKMISTDCLLFRMALNSRYEDSTLLDLLVPSGSNYAPLAATYTRKTPSKDSRILREMSIAKRDMSLPVAPCQQSRKHDAVPCCAPSALHMLLTPHLSIVSTRPLPSLDRGVLYIHFHMEDLQSTVIKSTAYPCRQRRVCTPPSQNGCVSPHQ